MGVGMLIKNKLKDILPQIITGVITGLLVSIVIAVFNYWMQIPLLRSQVDDLRASQVKLFQEFDNLQQKYFRIEGFLAGKLNYHYSAFVEISNQKKIPQKEFKTALPILEHNPEEAASYLMQKLNFSPTEVKSVLTMPKKD